MQIESRARGKGVRLLMGLICWFAVLSAQALQAQPADTVLKLAIIPHRSALGNEQAYSLVIKTMEQETGLTIQWIGSKTYADVIKKLRAKTVDLGYVGAFAYVEAQDAFGVRLIARTLGENQRVFYYSMIIARKDSGLNTLQELKGKRFAFTDPKSTSGFLFPVVGLKKAGVDLNDFSEVVYVKRHANSLLAVYNRHTDAGAISSTAKDKVDLDFGQFKVLWRSDPIYRGAWVARKDLADETFFKIQSALLKMSRSEDAGMIFKDLGTKGFIKGLDRDYDNVREVLRLKQELEEQTQ